MTHVLGYVPIFGGIAQTGVAVVAAVMALTWSILVISVSWLVVRPLPAIVGIGAVLFLWRKLFKKQDESVKKEDEDVKTESTPPRSEARREEPKVSNDPPPYASAPPAYEFDASVDTGIPAAGTTSERLYPKL